MQKEFQSIDKTELFFKIYWKIYI